MFFKNWSLRLWSGISVPVLLNNYFTIIHRYNVGVISNFKSCQAWSPVWYQLILSTLMFAKIHVHNYVTLCMRKIFNYPISLIFNSWFFNVIHNVEYVYVFFIKAYPSKYRSLPVYLIYLFNLIVNNFPWIWIIEFQRYSGMKVSPFHFFGRRHSVMRKLLICAVK